MSIKRECVEAIADRLVTKRNFIKTLDNDFQNRYKQQLELVVSGKRSIKKLFGSKERKKDENED